jgi:hypothetical protein
VSSKVRNKTGSTLPLIQHSLGISDKALSQEEDMKGVQIRGISQTIPICRQHDLKDKRSSTKKFLSIRNTFSKLAGYKIDLQNSVALIYTNNEQTEKEYRKIIQFTIA